MLGPVFQKGTLLIPTGGTDHLHIVMNDPLHCPVHGDFVVLLVNVSSVYAGKYHDPTCVLAPGSHAFIKRDSWVVYREAVVSRVRRLEDGLLRKVIGTNSPFSNPVFQQVRAGFDVSPAVSVKVRRFLKLHNI